MRQLVSVVDPDQIRYFVHEDDDVTQVAQILNPGLGVRDVIELGTMLGGLYERPRAVNGHGPDHRAVAAPAPAALPAQGYRPGEGTQRAAILDYIAAHPGQVAAEITDGLNGPSRQVIHAELANLRKAGLITFTGNRGERRYTAT